MIRREISLNAQGGSSSISSVWVEVYAGSSDHRSLFTTENGNVRVERVPIPVRRGYTFLGYYPYESDDSVYWGVQIVDSTGSFNWNAWAPRVFSSIGAKWEAFASVKTLNYCNGKGSGELVVMLSGENPSSVAVPTWRGHRFLGYFKTATGGTKYISDDGTLLVPMSSLPNTLYANWETAPTYEAEDFFCLASDALVPITSTSGSHAAREAVSHYGRYSSGVNESGGVLLAPSVTYAVVKNTTLGVTLGRAFAAQYSGARCPFQGISSQR